jgi:hypothetical protein
MVNVTPEAIKELKKYAAKVGKTSFDIVFGGYG